MAFVAMRYDLRAAPFSPVSHADLYRAALDQAGWADEQEVADVVTLSEHHGTDDGYLPAPFAFAAAVAARTRRVRIMIAAALFPFHDPIRLAEQIAVADLIAGPGRLWTVAGAGYRAEEFQMAGLDPADRGRVLQEWTEVCRQAWTGEPFERMGRTVRVTPRPVTQPHPVILMGGSSPAAARRAARLRLGFFPAVADPELQEAYEQECAAQGWDGGFVLMPPQSVGYVFVADDPEREWARIERYAWYDAETYRSWQTPGVRSAVTSKASSPEELRTEGLYRVMTPDEVVEHVGSQGPMANVVLHPLIGGMPPEWGWESLELFRDKVLPRLREGP